MTARSPLARLEVSLVASAMLHVAAVAIILLLPAPRRTQPVEIFPISLVALPGDPGGGGGHGGGTPMAAIPPTPAAEPAREAPPPVPPAAPPKPRPIAKPKPVERPKIPTPEPPAAALASRGAPPSDAAPPGDVGRGTSEGTGTGAGEGSGPGSGGGHGGGSGGGEGSGDARVAYGQNPTPPYPMIAKRLGMEGVVLLEVVVLADGRPSGVRVVRSSGHPPLDESAVSTVSGRWRFVPARRDGAAVESRVTVPIRFRLHDAEG